MNISDLIDENEYTYYPVSSSNQGSEIIISIITVVKNGENSIASTIESVAKNKSNNIEFIIIDGCSTDGTLGVVHKYACTVDRWISEPDSGIYDAMNKGVALAKGNWLYFLNSGDRLKLNLINIMINDLMNSNYPKEAIPKIIAGRVNMVDDTGCSLGYTHPAKISRLENLLNENCIAHQATLIRSDLFSTHGLFSSKYTIMGDYEYWIRLMKGGEKFHFCSHVVADFVVNGISSRRSSFPKATQERMDILVCHGYMTNINRKLSYIWLILVFTLKSFIRSLIGKKLSTKFTSYRFKR